MLEQLTRTYEPALDRLLGLQLGHALGDAFGGPYEFAPNLAYQDQMCYPMVHHRRFQSSQTGVIGQVTDDTEMTLALLQAILTTRNYSYEAVLSHYMNWAQAAPFCGRNTRALFKGVTTVAGAQTRWARQFADPAAAEATQSNGCLMRCTPLLLFDRNVAIFDCRLSNPSSVCCEAVTSYLDICQHLWLGHAIPDFLPEILANLRTPMLVETAQHVQTLRLPRFDPAIARGWVVHAWSFALLTLIWLQEEQFTYSELLRRVVRQYPRGDTDTNAAIAGAVFGVARGLAGLRQEPVTAQNLQILLSANTAAGEIPRPVNYHPANYFNAAPLYLALFATS